MKLKHFVNIQYSNYYISAKKKIKCLRLSVRRQVNFIYSCSDYKWYKIFQQLGLKTSSASFLFKTITLTLLSQQATTISSKHGQRFLTRLYVNLPYILARPQEEGVWGAMAEAPGKHSLIVSGTVAGPQNEEYVASRQDGSGELPNEGLF